MLTISMTTRVAILVLFIAGCGARVETPVEPITDAGSDTSASSGGAIPFADAGSGGSGGSVPATDVAPPEPGEGWGDGPAITSIDACGSSATVDKLIAHTSAPLAALPTPPPIQVIPGGTTCEVLDARSPTGEYAFSAKCGLVDKSQKITVVIREGVKSVDGRAMVPGTHVFFPTTKPGRLCGTAFDEVSF
jgi:hypothetical protein